MLTDAWFWVFIGVVVVLVAFAGWFVFPLIRSKWSKPGAPAMTGGSSGTADTRGGHFTKIHDSFWTWLFSLGCMLGIPSLPLGIEEAKNAGEVKPESFFLTAAVLAASFGIASEHNSFRFGYIMVFLGTIALDFQPADPHHSWLSAGWAARFMILVAILHAIERFTWHVVLNHRFPDWLKEP